ncbi:MAG: MAPEG family protein [Pseudomonadota bacterium]
MSLTITPIYAGVLALMFVVLSFRVIGRRRAAQVRVGDGSDILLQRRLRVHGNFAEYVPIALVLMLLLELQGKSDIVIHVVGALLIIGRVIHAIGLGREPDLMLCRVLGMVLTFIALIVGAFANLGLATLLSGSL